MLANLNFWCQNLRLFAYCSVLMLFFKPVVYAYADVLFAVVVGLYSVLNLLALLYVYKKEGKFFVGFRPKIDKEVKPHKPNKKTYFILIACVGFMVGVSLPFNKKFQERNSLISQLIRTKDTNTVKVFTDKAEYVISKGTPFYKGGF